MIKAKAKKIEAFATLVEAVILRLEKMGLSQFADRIDHLKENLSSLSDHTIRGGLVGITSSGKSSVLNVLLGTGKKILKEQSKATTNMIVFCSKAKAPALEIIFENKAPIVKKGTAVLDQSIWEFTSEDENPANKHKVKYINLKLPSFILDDNLEIADTPGLDAYGFKEHEDLTLREFLPQADLIVYLTSIRSPMKEADRLIMNKIMDSEQQIVFVQTCKGAVVEQDYGDGATTSEALMLDRYKKDFEDAISPYDKLKGAPIVQVETKQAMGYFKSKAEDDWEYSGFGELTQILGEITGQLKDKYTLRELRKRTEEILTLNRLIQNSLRKESEREKGVTELADVIQKTRYYLDKIAKNKDDTVSQWASGLDHAALYDEIKKELETANSEEEFFVISDTVGERVKKIKSAFLDALDHSKRNYKHYFGKIGLDVRRTDMQDMTKSAFFFPNVQKTVRKQTLSKKKRLVIDKDQYYANLNTTLVQYFDPLLKHLTWWDHSVAFSFLRPLEKKIAAFEKDMSNIQKHSRFDKNQHLKLSAISQELDTILDDVAPLCREDPFQQQVVVSKYQKKPLGGYTRRPGPQNLFMQLGALLFENQFHTYYFKLLGEISGKRQHRIALIGQDVESQIHFLRRLLRLDDGAFTQLQTATPPFSVNISFELKGIEDINLPCQFYDELAFVVLGNDQTSLTKAKAANLFKEVDVIQVFVDDLHRVSSAVSDIKERNLFFPLIRKHQEKILMAYAKAAYFQKERLHLLVEEVLVEFDRIFEAEQRHWFIYENFEIRYNFYNEIGFKMKQKKLSVSACIDAWKSFGLPLDEPFSERILKEQFEAIT